MFKFLTIALTILSLTLRIDSYICCKNVLMRDENGTLLIVCSKIFSPWPCTPDNQIPPNLVSRFNPEEVTESSEEDDDDMSVSLDDIQRIVCPEGEYPDRNGVCRKFWLLRRK